MKRREFPKDARYLCVSPATAARLRSGAIQTVGRATTASALVQLVILEDKRVEDGLIVILDHRREPVSRIDLNRPELGSPPLRYRVRGTPSSVRCRYCPGRIVWQRVAGSEKIMPLSWASREAWIEEGVQVGLIFQPHFADCPSWPGRAKRPKA